MTLDNTFRLIALFTATVLVSKGPSLFVGTHILVQRRHPWAVPKNTVLLALDVAAGIAIGAGSFRAQPVVLLMGVGLAAITHLYRNWEALKRPAPRETLFCASRALLVVNNIKLIGALATGWLGLLRFG